MVRVTSATEATEAIDCGDDDGVSSACVVKHCGESGAVSPCRTRELVSEYAGGLDTGLIER